MRNLRFGELLALAGDEGGLDALAPDYGDRARPPALREALATRCGVAPGSVVTFPGTMLGLHLPGALSRALEDAAGTITPRRRAGPPARPAPAPPCPR